MGDGACIVGRGLGDVRAAHRDTDAGRQSCRPGRARARFLCVSADRLQPLRAGRSCASGGEWAQPLAAGSRPRLSSADFVHRLCRIVGCVQPRGRGAADPRGRPGTSAGNAAVGAVELGVSHTRNHRRQLLGLLRTRMGRLVVLGPGRKCLTYAVAGRDRLAPQHQRACRARGSSQLDDDACRRCILHVDAWHLPSPLGDSNLGPQLRGRPDARQLHSRAARLVCGRVIGVICRPRQDGPRRHALCTGQPRGCAGAQQSAAQRDPRHRPDRNALSVVR